MKPAQRSQDMWIEQRSSSISPCPFNPTLPIQYEKSLFFHWHVYIGILLNELSIFPFLSFSKSNFRSKKFDFDFCLGGWPFLATGNAWMDNKRAKMRCRQQADNKTAISRFLLCLGVCNNKQIIKKQGMHRSISIKRSITPQSILNTIAPFYWPKLSAFDRITSSSESSSFFFYRLIGVCGIVPICRLGFVEFEGSIHTIRIRGELPGANSPIEHRASSSIIVDSLKSLYNILPK